MLSLFYSAPFLQRRLTGSLETGTPINCDQILATIFKTHEFQTLTNLFQEIIVKIKHGLKYMSNAKMYLTKNRSKGFQKFNIKVGYVINTSSPN